MSNDSPHLQSIVQLYPINLLFWTNALEFNHWEWKKYGVDELQKNLEVSGHEATMACGKKQLYAGLEASIHCAIYTMCQIWEINLDDDEWGFLLVHTRNLFNKLSCKAVL